MTGARSPRRSRSATGAVLIRTRVAAEPRAVVLVLHGGAEVGQARVRAFMPAVLRCRAVAAAFARRDRTLAIYRLQYAVTGWNGDGSSALADGAWAVAEVAERHPQLPLVLVGHSMGGRVAVRTGTQSPAIGAVGLAPWLPPTDPVAHLGGVPLEIIQGDRDAELPPASTAQFQARALAAGARIHTALIRGGGHAMVRRFGRWHAAAVAGTERVLADRG